MKARERKGSLLTAAVDIGGTKILAGVIAGDSILSRVEVPTEAHIGVEGVVGRILSALHSGLVQAGKKPADLAGIGIACAGLIEPEAGVVVNSPNLPGWSLVPLAARSRDEFGLPTLVMNDANAAAVGEHRFGAGREVRHLIYITISTGIGGGLILNGELYNGAWGTAGEVGHMTIDANGPPCSCGNWGCLESLASGTALARDAAQRLSKGERSSLRELSKGNLNAITAALIHQAALTGDALALELIAQAGQYLGIGMANLVNLLNPQLFIVGGGVARMGELLLAPARKVMRQRAFPVAAELVRVAPAALGGNAGLLGVAACLRDKLEAP